MKAEDLRLDDLIRSADGRLDIRGRRLVIHDLHAMGQFARDLVGMVGPAQARRIFTRFGYFWGQADAAAMDRIFRWDSVTEWLAAGPRLHTLQGLARVEVHRLEVDEAAGRCTIECTWHDSGEAHVFLEENGVTAEPSCWIQTGYASGYASHCLGNSVYFVETRCRARGDKACVVVGKDVNSWGDEIKSHLPFFHADDIQGKIRKLTNQLRRRDREIEKANRGPHVASVPVRSTAYRSILDVAERIARFDSSLLITGETGVGKEVLAHHIHRISPRADGPFVAVNCAALPEALLESELFGHRAGSFTGALRDQPGLFEEAAKGIIFLDEIGETSQATQLRFLRVLQEHEVTRVGEARPRRVDVRIIAATNRDIEKAVAGGAFREDLFYRLQVFRIEVPPLRKRTEDIIPLAQHFVETSCLRLKLPRIAIAPECFHRFLEYEWPGNVRELKNAIEYAAVLARDGKIRPQDLPAKVTRKRVTKDEPDGGDLSLAAVERKQIERVLSIAGGNRLKAARLLGIGTATLYRKLRAFRRDGTT